MFWNDKLATVEPVKSWTGLKSELIEKYLVFHLAGESYGLSVDSVEDIHEWSGVVQVPESPPYVRGIIFQQQTVLPIVDLRTVFRCEPRKTDEGTCVISLKLPYKGRVAKFGFQVDLVDGLLKVGAEEIRQAPEKYSDVRSSFITGMAKTSIGDIYLINASDLLAHESIQ